MKTVSVSLLLYSVFATLTHAQEPIAAGYSPVINVSGGYSYVNLGVPSLHRLNLQGVELGVTVDIRSRFGIELDGSYTRGSNVYGSGHVADLLTYMAGPVFYPVQKKKLNVYVHGLLGGARETGVNYNSTGEILLGYVGRVAWAAGGGAEYEIDRHLSVRVGCDLLNTAIFNPQLTIQRENSIRAFAGFSYRFGGRRP
jgi:opacity protein-like surface antigen